MMSLSCFAYDTLLALLMDFFLGRGVFDFGGFHICWSMAYGNHESMA
jgi:hypothetical protein